MTNKEFTKYLKEAYNERGYHTFSEANFISTMKKAFRKIAEKAVEEGHNNQFIHQLWLYGQ